MLLQIYKATPITTLGVVEALWIKCMLSVKVDFKFFIVEVKKKKGVGGGGGGGGG